MADQRLYQKIANQILELIDSGVFPPGTRLPSERDLAEKFGVSRVSVREAGIALQAQGRLDIKVGSGAYVVDGSDRPFNGLPKVCLLYTSPSPRDKRQSRMPSSA